MHMGGGGGGGGSTTVQTLNVDSLKSLSLGLHLGVSL